jgi:hypothetical protein
MVAHWVRALGGHRAQSRRGGAIPAGEPVAKEQRGLRLKHQWGWGNPRGMDRGVGAHRGALPTGGGERRPVRANGDARQGSSIVACGEDEVGEARNSPRFLEQQRGGQSSTEPTNRRRIPTVALFTVVGNNWKCGGLGGS